MRDLFAKAAADDANLMRRTDARTKLLVTMAVAILTVACSGLASQLLLFAATLVYALLIRRPKLLAVLYLLMIVMMAVAAGSGLLLERWLPGMGGLSLKSLVIPFLRGLSMMNVVIVLALTTRVEDLLATLERMHLPFCLFLPTAVMLRFIPTFANDIKQVWETLRIKGWPLGPAMLTMQPLLSARLLLVPILFRALKSSETLGVASELKGLGAARRTMRSDAQTMTSLDARLISATILVTLLVIAAEVFLKTLFLTPLTSAGMP